MADNNNAFRGAFGMMASEGNEQVDAGERFFIESPPVNTNPDEYANARYNHYNK